MNLLRNFEQLSRETPNDQLHRTRKRQAKRRRSRADELGRWPAEHGECETLGSGVTDMSKIESIEEQIKALSADELTQLRAWFLEFD